MIFPFYIALNQLKSSDIFNDQCIYFLLNKLYL